MSFLAFPLRLQNSFLLRTGEVEAVLSLIRMMAATPGGSWVGSRHFGVRDIFESARTRPNAIAMALAEMNLALKDLDISDYRVESISREAAVKLGIDSYLVTIVSGADESRTYSIGVDA